MACDACSLGATLHVRQVSPVAVATRRARLTLARDSPPGHRTMIRAFRRWGRFACVAGGKPVTPLAFPSSSPDLRTIL